MGKHEKRDMEKDIRSLQATRVVLHDSLAGTRSCRFWMLRRGQQVIEYAIVISVVSAIFLSMFIYARRGLSSVIKQQSDILCPQKHYTPTIVSYHEEADVHLAKDENSREAVNTTAGFGVQKTSESTVLSTGVHFEIEEAYY